MRLVRTQWHIVPLLVTLCGTPLASAQETTQETEPEVARETEPGAAQEATESLAPAEHIAADEQEAADSGAESEPLSPDTDTDTARESDAASLSAQLERPTPPAVATPTAATPQPRASAIVAASSTPEQRPLYWRLARVGTQRPLTLPQGVMTFTSTAGLSIVETGVGSSTGRANTFLGYAIGAMDDWELGLTLPGLQYMPPFKILDPSFYTRVRLVSGEVQVAVRAEITAPVDSQGSAWMGLGAEVAWSPESWFRFQTGAEYGLRFSSPLQQTIYVPVRALFSAGPNTWSVATGLVMYNDADDFDVPLMARWAVAIRGQQGPHSEAAIEGGIADLTGSQGWFIRGDWTFFASP